MKLCIKCKNQEQRPYNSYCKSCHNDYQKAYYKKNSHSIKISSVRRRGEIREMIKKAKSGPCIDCGKSYPYYVMDFDHVRGKKKFNLSIAARNHKNLATVREEIEKCDLVCANCHRERTFKNNTESSNR